MADTLFDIEFHEAANLFPLDEATLDELAEDIRANEQQVAIKLFEGKILDGRRRYLACKRLGIEPKFKTVNPADPIAYSLSLNLKRRNLKPSQKAMVGARATELRQKLNAEGLGRKKQAGGDKKSAAAKSLQDLSPEAIPDAGQSRDQIGDILGVSGRTVDRAARVIREGTESLAAAVDAGQLSVSAAALAAPLPAAEQDALAAQAMAGEGPRQGRPMKKPEPEGTPAQKSKALDLAAEAINDLKRIPMNNPYRDEAFRIVKKWINDAKRRH